MKTYWGIGGIAPRIIWPLALDEWPVSRPGRFTSRETAPGTHWIGGWVGPRAGLDTVPKRKIPIPRRESNSDHLNSGRSCRYSARTLRALLTKPCNLKWCYIEPFFWYNYFSSYSVIRGAAIAQWYSAGLGVGWLGVRVPAVFGNFSLHHRIQTGSGAHPASYPMGTKGSFPEGWSGLDVKQTTRLHPCRGQRISVAIPPLSQYSFMVWRSVKKSTGTTLPYSVFRNSRKVWWMRWVLDESFSHL
jgi:hypothetical protein